MTDDIPDTGAVFTYGKSHFADNEPSHFFIKSDPVVALSCGDEHSAVICQNGRVFAFGANAWGQLGLGHKDEVTRPSCVKWLKPHRALLVACGRAHTVFVTDNHALYTSGCNEDGQLGTGDAAPHSVPQYVELCDDDERVKQVAAGSSHTAVLTESGRVFVCGSNTEGQLGLGDDTRVCLKFTELKFMEKIAFVECGYYHTVFITTKGAVFVTGDNEGQKLGVPNTAANIYVPEVMPLEVAIKDACCGANHTFLLSMDETKILAFGSNERGQLGLPKDVDFVKEPTEIDMERMFDGHQLKLVACGAMHTAFVTDNGSLYTCGEARHNKLCLEETAATDADPANQYEPARVAAMADYVVDNVACGGCHTLLTATKAPNDASPEHKRATLPELPPLQKVPLNLSPPTQEHTDVNGHEDTGSINSLEANVGGSHIDNINDLEAESESMKDVLELDKDVDRSSPIPKSEVMEIIDNMDKLIDKGVDKVDTGIQDIVNKGIDGIDKGVDKVDTGIQDVVNKGVDGIDKGVDKVQTGIQDAVDKGVDKVEAGIHDVTAAAGDKVEVLDEMIKKVVPEIPDHKCAVALEPPDKTVETANSPPPKSPILQQLLSVPDLTQINTDEDAMKSETGSKSENETLPCESDCSSARGGKTAKTQAVMPIVRSEDGPDFTTEPHQEDSEVVINKLQDKGRFSRLFQTIRDKENSCMSKGKVIEEKVEESVHAGVTSAEDAVHRVEQTVETEIRNQTNSRTCTLL